MSAGATRRSFAGRRATLVALAALLGVVPAGVLDAGGPGPAGGLPPSSSTLPPDTVPATTGAPASTEAPTTTEVPTTTGPSPSEVTTVAPTSTSPASTTTTAVPATTTSTSTTITTTTTTTTTTVATAPAIFAAAVVAAPVPAPTCTVSLTVQLGTRGDPARCVETRLVQLGYWLAGPDDNFDATGVHALKAFQTKNGVTASGIAGKATLQLLRLWTEPRPVPPATCRTPWPVYRGDSGYPARCVETRLVQFGYWLVGPNDTFDSTAVVALLRFQARQGLASTGFADFPTLVRLGIYTPHARPAATCDTHYAVRLGSTGTGARCVEARLVQLGYWLVGPDGSFDVTAVNALRNFQYKNGLLGDGIAGVRTLSRMGIYDPNPPPATALPDNSGTGRRIVYSRAQQRLWVVEADGTVVKTHRVSGRTYEPYSGTYYVYSRSLYTNSATDPSVRWRYMVRFAYGPQGGRIGFHEIPNRNGRPLQSKEQLGLPLSGGCVRQSSADALWVWNWAGIGTKVVVL